MARINILARGVSRKKKGIALIICLMFGLFGFHYFYVGRTAMGILYLCTFGLCGIGWIVDIFKIAKGNFTDKYGDILA